jgi:hypothetical protein
MSQTSMDKTKMVAGIVGIIIVALVVGYLVGNAHGKSVGLAQAAAARQSGFRGTRGANGGSAVMGTILSQDAQSITVSLRNGGSQVIFLSGSTGIMKSVSGTATDLAVGQNIVATGTTNSDGSLTATSVQIRPAMQTPPAGTGTPGAPSGN